MNPQGDYFNASGLLFEQAMSQKGSVRPTKNALFTELGIVELQ